MVTSLQVVLITVPKSVVVSPQRTRSPTTRTLDSVPVIRSNPEDCAAVHRVGPPNRSDLMECQALSLLDLDQPVACFSEAFDKFKKKKKKSVEIFEIRSHRTLKGKPVEHRIAKATYLKGNEVGRSSGYGLI